MVKDKPKQRPEDDGTTTTVGVGQIKSKHTDKVSGQTSGGVGDGKEEDKDDTSKKTVGGSMSAFRHSFQKTKGRFQRIFLGRNKRKPDVKCDASSITSDVTMDHMNSSLTEDKKGIKIVVTPFVGILLHDVTIAVLILFVLAAIPTAYNWTNIMKHQLPSSLIMLWLIVAFLVGIEIGRVKGMRTVLDKHKKKANKSLHNIARVRVTDTAEGSGHFEPPDLRHSLPSEILVAEVCENENEPVKEGYALFYTLLSPKTPWCW